MKPDWKDAPEWANWLTMDQDGNWFGYEKKPIAGNRRWRSSGKWDTVSQTEYWQESLQERPDKVKYES